MSMSDITTGTNSFYILQLLETKKGKQSSYVVFCKWGRTGTYIGSSKCSSHKSLAEAVRDFEYVLKTAASL